MLGKRSAVGRDEDVEEDDLFADILPKVPRATDIEIGHAFVPIEDLITVCSQPPSRYESSVLNLATQAMPNVDEDDPMTQNWPFSPTFTQIRTIAYAQSEERYVHDYTAISTPIQRRETRPNSTNTANDTDQPTATSQHFQAPTQAGVVLTAAPIAARSNIAISVVAPTTACLAPVVSHITVTPIPIPPTPRTVHLKAILYFDGGSLGNPGVGGAGYLLYPDSQHPPHESPAQPFAQAAVRIPWARCTNNQAEYEGLIHGLQAARAKGVHTLTVYGDSQLVIKQMTGEYRVKDYILQGLHQRARQLATGFTNITYQWVRRENNATADALSQRAMRHPTTAGECAERLG